MKFSFITLFPSIIQAYTQASIIGKAQERSLIEVETLNPRDYSLDPHRKVDDAPYGGGAGMVLTCQPVERAYEELLPLKPKTRLLMLSPTGRRFDHAMAIELATQEQLVFFCGHYEGFDERIKVLIPHIEEVSLGDFVLTGGELPALSIMDAVSRHLPGVVKEMDSVRADSFYNGLLDYPHYTRPAEYKGHKVPEVLLSGNHEKIAQWRYEESLKRTQACRPDLLERL